MSKQLKFLPALSITAALAAASLAGCSGASPETNPSAATGPGRGTASSYQDNFYDAVNHETLAGWEIPADQADMSWFRAAREDSYQKVDAIIRQASADTGQKAGGDLDHIRALNLTGLDREARNRGGYGRPAGQFLKEVEDAATVKELLRSCLRFQRDYGYRSLIGLDYAGDGEDSSQKVLYVLKPDMGLNREVWFAGDEDNINRVQKYKEFLIKLHQINGAGKKEAEARVQQVTSLMADLAASSLSIQETYDAAKTYNVYKAKEAAALYSGAVTMDYLKEIYEITEDEKTIVEEPDLCRKLGGYLKEENLPLLKEYVRTCLYQDMAMATDMSSLNAAQEYEAAVNGATGRKSFERTVSETVQSILGFQCGRVFCGMYFKEDAKRDVESMIRQVIDVYDRRLAHMEWMSEPTRREARKKLASITVKVGYPDNWPQDRYDLDLKGPEEGGLFADNILAVQKASQDYKFKTRRGPVDKTEWHMTPQTVNAYYNPGSNEIVFPAGILQPPFYEAGADPVVNLGGIGTIIGHEITHAFDTSGSQYDENGNLRDWWTPEDKKRFEELSQKVIDYYSSMEAYGITVNGSLSVTENIADLGGLSCATQIARENGCDLRKLYESYACIWASKYRDAYLSYLMSNNPHSPGIIRVNAVLSALDDFYTAYGVKEGDGMYQPPQNRPKVW